MGSELASSLFFCCPLNHSRTAVQAISKKQSHAYVTVCLKPFNGSSLPFGWSRVLVTVTLGPEVQASLMLKGNPNKNLSKW